MEGGDTEKYHPSSVIQDFVFPSRKSSCIRCISLQVYNKWLHVYYSLFVCVCLDVLMFVCLCLSAFVMSLPLGDIGSSIFCNPIGKF